MPPPGAPAGPPLALRPFPSARPPSSFTRASPISSVPALFQVAPHPHPLQVQVALDLVEHLVVDRAFVAQADHGVVLRPEKLLLETPAALEELFMPAVGSPSRPRPEPMQRAGGVLAEVVDGLRRRRLL